MSPVSECLTNKHAKLQMSTIHLVIKIVPINKQHLKYSIVCNSLSLAWPLAMNFQRDLFPHLWWPTDISKSAFQQNYADVPTHTHASVSSSRVLPAVHSWCSGWVFLYPQIPSHLTRRWSTSQTPPLLPISTAACPVQRPSPGLVVTSPDPAFRRTCSAMY